MEVVLVKITLKNAPTTPTAPFLSQELHLTTTTSDVTPMISTGVTWLHGWIASDGEIRYSSSADPSQGKGVLAEAIQGEITLVDDGISNALDHNAYSIQGARVQFLIGNQIGGILTADPTPRVELSVVDKEVQDGTIKLVLKDPSYVVDQPIYGARAVTKLSTDPDDPENPTDPTYLSEELVSQFAGAAFGCVPVSLKTSTPLVAAKIAYYKPTTYSTGDLAGTATEGYVCATKGDILTGAQSADSSWIPILDKPVVYGGTIIFKCRRGDSALAEANRVVAELDEFVAKGYRIVLSNGTWFVDLAAQKLWQGDLVTRNQFTFETPIHYDEWINTHFTPDTHGKPYGVLQFGFEGQSVSCVWFSLTDADGNDLFASDLDPNSVEVFAVPQAFAVANSQVHLDGFANNKKTVYVSGVSELDNGIEVFYAPLVSSSGIVSSQNIPFVVHWEGNVLHDSGTGTAAGNTSSVKTDVRSPWKVGDPTLDFGVSGAFVTGVSKAAELNIRAGLNVVDADLISLDTSFELVYHLENKSVIDDSVGIGIVPAFGSKMMYIEHIVVPAWRDSGSNHYADGSLIISADKARGIPLWGVTQNTIDTLNQASAPAVYMGNAHCVCDFTMKLREIFLWAFKRCSFSSIYMTVFPFWTRSGLLQPVSDGGPHLLMGGSGFGRVVKFNPVQRFAWTPFSLPNPVGGGITAAHSAYNHTTGKWLTSGWGHQNDSLTCLPLLWESDDGINWNVIFTGNTYSANLHRDAFQIVCSPTEDKYILISSEGGGFGYRVVTGGVVGNFSTFPSSVTLTCRPFCLHDGTRFWFFGDAGESFYSTDLVSFTQVGGNIAFPVGLTNAGAGCATYVKTAGFEGIVVSGDSSTHSYGQIARATLSDAMAGTWTAGVISGSGRITSLAAGSSDVMACSLSGAWAMSNPVIWSWRQVIGPEAFAGAYQASVANVKWADGGDGYEEWLCAINSRIGNQILVSDQAWQSDPSNVPDWTPTATRTPAEAIWNIRNRYLGATKGNANPIRWTYQPPTRASGYAPSFGIAFEPPSTENNDYSGTNAIDAARKIAQEWWVFAGPMNSDPAQIMDGSNDNIQMAFPELTWGNIQDVATLLTVQYQPFGGEYLGHAYVQNVDKEYTSGSDSFYFAGWDADGSNTNGLAIWNICRAAYLATGTLRSVSLTFDSVQDAETMGALMLVIHPDMGRRLSNICNQTRYFKCEVDGNDSVAALVMPGNRYKPNPTVFNGRGLVFGNSTSAGICVDADHDIQNAKHTITIALPPI